MKCSRCEAEVRWALTERGALLAVVPDPGGRMQLEWREEGRVQGWVVIFGDEGGYSPHFCNIPRRTATVRA